MQKVILLIKNVTCYKTCKEQYYMIGICIATTSIDLIVWVFEKGIKMTKIRTAG